MNQPAALAPSPSSSSFAGLLTSLASSPPVAADHDGELADDVVTISYEQALRNHARYRPGHHGGALEPPAGSPNDWAKAPAAIGARSDETAAVPDDELGGSSASRELRTSSVTIRLSTAECAQLRQRATEAGITVSAYLRSCVLEADALRAQVKEALANFKAAAGTQSAAAPVRRPLFGWMRRTAKR